MVLNSTHVQSLHYHHCHSRFGSCNQHAQGFFRALKNLYTSICGTTLDPNYEEVIDSFVYEWNLLTKHCGISKTLKIHIIEHHVKDYIRMTGLPLGKRTDQTTEAAHQYLNKRLLRSNYRVKDIESHVHGLKLYRCVSHMNAYNV